MQARDITALSPEALAAELNLGPVGAAIDVLVGGPPCQAFARVGRSKLREIDEHPQAFKHDPRAKLYLEYLRYVAAFQPLAILMENVPDVLNHGGQNIAEEICEVLATKGYVVRYTLLNAAFYGVPQMRERMFLIGYHRDLGDNVTFPQPTHWVDLPSGYESSRSVALKLMSGDGLLQEAFDYVTPPEATPSLSSCRDRRTGYGRPAAYRRPVAGPIGRAATWRAAFRPACALRSAPQSVGVRTIYADLARLRGTGGSLRSRDKVPATRLRIIRAAQSW